MIHPLQCSSSVNLAVVTHTLAVTLHLRGAISVLARDAVRVCLLRQETRQTFCESYTELEFSASIQFADKTRHTLGLTSACESEDEGDLADESESESSLIVTVSWILLLFFALSTFSHRRWRQRFSHDWASRPTRFAISSQSSLTPGRVLSLMSSASSISVHF